MFKKLLYDLWNLCTKSYEHIETVNALFEKIRWEEVILSIKFFDIYSVQCTSSRNNGNV